MEIRSKNFKSLYIPESAKGPPAAKIMIVMHGLGDQLDSYEMLTREINVTGLKYLLINAPMEYVIGYSWYDLPPDDPYLTLNKSLDLLESLVVELNEQGFSNKNIIPMGFSQGGCMALELANRVKEPFEAVVALSPRIYMNPNQLSDSFKAANYFVAHGFYDEAIPYSETSQQIKLMQEQGVEINFHSFDMGHEIDINEIDELRPWLNNFL